MSSTASLKRSMRDDGSNPKERHCSSSCPAPSPRMKRPSESSSSVSAILAVKDGCLKPVQATNVPIAVREVIAATAEAIVQPSHQPIGWSEAERHSNSSGIHTASKPALSAARMRSAISCHLAALPSKARVCAYTTMPTVGRRAAVVALMSPGLVPTRCSSGLPKVVALTSLPVSAPENVICIMIN